VSAQQELRPPEGVRLRLDRVIAWRCGCVGSAGASPSRRGATRLPFFGGVGHKLPGL